MNIENQNSDGRMSASKGKSSLLPYFPPCVKLIQATQTALSGGPGGEFVARGQTAVGGPSD